MFFVLNLLTLPAVWKILRKSLPRANHSREITKGTVIQSYDPLTANLLEKHYCLWRNNYKHDINEALK
jgi:hypothetical protein